MDRRRLQHVPEAPTNPRASPAGPAAFDVADLYRGPLPAGVEEGGDVALDEKLRQAYFWILNKAPAPHRQRDLDQTRAALAGIVQALLITRHMLFLGFSLSDPNFHRIAGDVRQAVRRDPHADPFGTAVVLNEEPLMDELWRGDITFVPMGSRRTPKAEAARRVELFLDRIAFVATDDTAHLMDPAYDGILTEPERWLRDHLQALRYQQP